MQLRFVIGHDGAKLGVKVADEGGDPVTDVNVFIIPDGVLSEPQLADRMMSGQLDQRGGNSSKALPTATNPRLF